jgi:nucleotide-binding universal stress UspA family protein
MARSLAPTRLELRAPHAHLTPELTSAWWQLGFAVRVAETIKAMAGNRPVMCAFEDTRDSQHALRAAEWLAGALDTSLVLAHVFDPGGVPVLPRREMALASVTEDDLERAARLGARRILERAAETVTDVAVHTEMPEDLPVPALLEAATAHDATLLVAGTAARAGLDRVLIGSVAGELAAHAPCPMIAVARAAALSEPGPIVAGYDGSTHSERAARHAARLAARMGRHLVLVHAAGEDEQVSIDPELPRALYAAAASSGEPTTNARDGFEVRLAVEEGHPVDVLAAVAREQAAPLIITGTRGRNAVTTALLGSVTAQLVRVAGRPIGMVSGSARNDPTTS